MCFSAYISKGDFKNNFQFINFAKLIQNSSPRLKNIYCMYLKQVRGDALLYETQHFHTRGADSAAVLNPKTSRVALSHHITLFSFLLLPDFCLWRLLCGDDTAASQLWKKNIPAKCISLSEAMWSKNIYFSALMNHNVMFEVWILLALILKPPIRFSTQTEHRRYSFYTIYTHQSKHKTVEKKNILYQTLIKRTKE